jgi:hypothetical protein
MDERATLELDNSIRARRSFFEMKDMVVSGKRSIRPGVRIGTIESEGISIMAVYVNGSRAISRRKDTFRSSVIADEREDDARIPILLLHISEIIAIREFI